MFLELPLASNVGTRERFAITFTIVKFSIQIDRQPDCKATNAEDDAGHKTPAGFPWYATVFWGRKTKEVPEIA